MSNDLSPEKKPKPQQKIVYGCWNNERGIAAEGHAGKLHAQLYDTVEQAKAHYGRSYVGDVIVKIWCEAVCDAGESK